MKCETVIIVCICTWQVIDKLKESEKKRKNMMKTVVKGLVIVELIRGRREGNEFEMA